MAEKNPRQGKTQGNFAKTQGILFAQIVNSLVLKVMNIPIFATKISMFFRSWKSQVGVVYVIVTHHINSHRKNMWSDMENTGNLKMQIEWCPD